MSVLKTGLHYLAGQRDVQQFVTRNHLSSRLARRFVAGEELDEAVDVARALNQRGFKVSLDFLGEAVASAAEADAAAEVILGILRAIQAAQADANVSLKLTQLGLDLDAEHCRALVERIVGQAAAFDNFIRLDMESTAYTQRTLELFEAVNARLPGRAGVVIQAYLRRSAADIEHLIQLGARVRLCKGAYHEPPELAFPEKADVDRHYVQLAKALLDRGHYPAIATHDESIIQFVRDYTARHAIPAARFEFQLLYGVRRDLQQQLVDAGYNVRIYVPFGSQWYPYFMRRLAERPANLFFLLSSVARDRGQG